MIKSLSRGTGPLLRVEGLTKHFPLRSRSPFTRSHRSIRAVDGVSFAIFPSETVALVGESGSGKTTTSRLILLLEKPTAGGIFVGDRLDRSVHELQARELREYRSTVQAVFQNPWSSLNPRMRVGDIIAEPLEINSTLSRRQRMEVVMRLLREVGLEPAAADGFPHEFSGGQRQRIALARALTLDSRLILLDEPVSALDVSMRAQIMNLLRDLQDKHAMAYLLIAHDLATVRYLSDRILVMYLGELVEEASCEDLFAKPLHPYTSALLAASSTGGSRETAIPKADPPSPATPPVGCRFHTRCPFAFERCTVEAPVLRQVAPGHKVACHLY